MSVRLLEKARIWMQAVLWCASLCTAFLPISADAIQAQELNQVWVRPDEAITPQKFSQILSLMREIPDTNRLLNEVTAKMGASSPEELIRIVSLCPPDGGNMGKFTQSTWQVVGSLQYSVDGVQPPLREEGRIRPEILRHKKVTDTEVRIDFINALSICLKPSITLLDSFLTFTHELTHFRGFLDFMDDDILRYADAEDYARKRVREKGQEWDSYVAEARALKAYRKAHPESQAAEQGYDRFFDADGRLIDEAGLELYVLSDDGLGYGHSYRERFFDELERSQQNAISDARNHHRYATNARSNQMILFRAATQNTSVLTRLRNPKLNTDPHKIREFEDLIREQEKQAKFYGDYATRAEQRARELDQRLQDIQIRFAQYLKKAS